ncbi:chromatin structure-remodeling complex subunit SFH1, partial [Tremellales sp. Uapishka_1]
MGPLFRVSLPPTTMHPPLRPTGNSSQRASPYPTSSSRPPITYRPPVSRPTYHHPPTYPPGPLGFFLPPPGQVTTDPTLATPPTSQAVFTTYPSRLRTGVTGLVQPETVTGGPKERELFLAELDREVVNSGRASGTSTPRHDSPAPFGKRASTSFSGRRTGRGAVVSYAEKDSSEEEEEEEEEFEEPPSDPEDDNYGRESRRPRRDKGFELQQPSAKMGRLRKRKDELEKGWTWLGARTPGDKVRSQVVKMTKHNYISDELLDGAATRPELLVPISLDFDVPSNNAEQLGIKVKDRFLWNINEQFITPFQFSSIFCEDLGIPVHPYAGTMTELIQGQIEEAQNAAEIDISNEEVGEDDVVWSDEEDEENMDGEEEEEEKMYEEADCRIIINLDVQIYTFILRDRIEWDLSSLLPPATFAKQYCAELGLTGEAIPLIAVAIHEEILKHKKDCLELELFSATHPEEQAKWEKQPGGLPKTNSRNGNKKLKGVWRDWWEREEYGPVLVELSFEEMERREQERQREARRVMRTLATGKRRR